MKLKRYVQAFPTKKVRIETGVLLALAAIGLILWFATSTLYLVEASSAHANVASIKPELVLQTGHTQTVSSVVFGPDGQWLASGSLDNTVKIWETATGRELRTLVGHIGPVKAIARSADGNWLASGGNDKTIRIWKVESGQDVRVLTGHNGSVEAVAYSSDGRQLASGSTDNTIKLWDVATGAIISTLVQHSDWITSLAFSPDGRTLASGSADNTIKLWDVSKGRTIRTLKGHNDRVKSIAFSVDGQLLASGSNDTTIKIWKVSSGHERLTLSGHMGKVLAVTFLPDGRLASGSTEQEIKIWDTVRGREINSTSRQIQTATTEETESVAFSSDGRLVAAGRGDRKIELFESAGMKHLQTLEAHSSGFYSVAFSPDGRWLATGSNDDTVKLWDLQTGQQMPPLSGHTGYVTSVAFSIDGERLASASIDRTIKIWNMTGATTPLTLKGHTDAVTALAISPDGERLVSGSVDRTIKLWKLSNGVEERTLTGHSGEITTVAVSANGHFIASGSVDKTVKLWDLTTKEEPRTLVDQEDGVESIAFSPDDKWLAYANVNGSIKIWNLKSGLLANTLVGHLGKAQSVAFSPDSRQIVSGSSDKTVKVWSVLSGREVFSLIGHVGTVYSVAFSSDGKWLASGSEDGSTIIWNSANGTRLATLVSIRASNDWLVVTPEGLFDGSPDSWDQILWRFGQNTFNIRPVEIFFSEFYSPGLLTDLLAGKQIKLAENIADKDRRQPQLSISLADSTTDVQSLSQRQVNLKIELHEAPPDGSFKQGTGARDVRLFRNGSLVKLWPGDVLANKGGAVVLDATVPLVFGKNEFTAYAFNHDNIKSNNTTLSVTGAHNLKRKGIAYIVAIGIGRYANPEYNLSYTESDASDFSDELLRKQLSLGTFEKVNVVQLLNQDATKANILAALKGLAGSDINSTPNLPVALSRLSRAQPEDAVFIYFSGHGTSQQDRFYMLPYDLGYTGPRSPLTALGLQTILSNSISDLELEEAIREIDAGQLLLVIDACNSGQALEAEEKRRGPMNTKGLAQLAYEKGMYILTASQSIELAYISAALKHSYLTYALVEEGLRTPLADTEPKDGQIILKEWFDYAIDRVPRLRQDKLGLSLVQQSKQLEEVEPELGGVQRPRAFYHQQRDLRPFVIAKIKG
jgi:WD40 repeat protein